MNITNIVLIVAIIACIVGVATCFSILFTKKHKKVNYVLLCAEILFLLVFGGWAFFTRFYPSVNLSYQSDLMKFIIFGTGTTITFGLGFIFGIGGAKKKSK